MKKFKCKNKDCIMSNDEFYVFGDLKEFEYCPECNSSDLELIK